MDLNLKMEYFITAKIKRNKDVRFKIDNQILGNKNLLVDHNKMQAKKIKCVYDFVIP